MQPFSVKIPSPCSQNWEEMDKVDKDRFCKSCNKIVVDFTGYSNDELIETLMASQTGRICGRMTNRQLNQIHYHLIPVTREINWKRNLGVLAVGALLLMSSCTKDPAENLKSEVKIYGYVADRYSEPISGAKVTIEGTEFVSVTDERGKYEIQTKRQFDHRLNQLVINIDGQTNTSTIDFTKPKQDTVSIYDPEYAIAGEISIMPVKKGK